MQVHTGTYLNDFTTITKPITLTAVDGPVIMSATTQAPNGKAILTIDASATIDGISFTGAQVSDGNGAGIRYEAGDLVVRNSLFYENQNGILGNPVPGGTILIDNSEFSHNGLGDGRTHNIYIGTIAKLTVQNSYFHDAVVGHEIKSRAATTIIQNNRIFDNTGSASYDIDLPDGGVGIVQNNIIQKSANAQNMWTIHYGGENPAPAGSSLLVTNNTIINDKTGGGLVANQSGMPVTVSSNKLFGYGATPINEQIVTMTGNTTLATRPTLDLTTRTPAVGATPLPGVTPVNPQPATSVAVPTGLTYQTFGTDGAVVASGRVLTVGASKAMFTSLQAALAGSKDGDRIQVAAGTYANEVIVIDHKVIIEGVGGIARFVAPTSKDGGRGFFTANTDATLRNLEISGADNWNGNMAGLYVAAGNVTLVNSYVHDNNVGLTTAENTAITLGIYTSEIGPNGNAAHGNNPVNINGIGSLTIRNSTIHGATTGHELKSKAWFNDIEDSRIYDDATSPSSFLLNLAQGGQATIKNNVFYKGPASVNGTLIHVGGEGPTYANTDVQITGNTIVSNLQNAGHPWTYFITGDNSGGVLAPKVTANNNKLVGGVAGSFTLQGATGTGNTSLAYGAAGTALDTSAPWSAAAAPAKAFTAATGPNHLSVVLTEWTGGGTIDSQATIFVDGTAVAGGAITAIDGKATQTIDAYGTWAAGAHTVTVQFDNPSPPLPSAYLTVKSVSLDGATVSPFDMVLGQTGGRTSSSYSTTLTTTPTTTPTPTPTPPPTTTPTPTPTTPPTVKSPLPGFDAAWYLAKYADVKASGIDPLTHYLNWGWKSGYDPGAQFSTNYYLLMHPDAAATGLNPLLHYETVGWKLGYDTSFTFSTSKYLAAHPDAAAANVDPLQAYQNGGKGSRRHPDRARRRLCERRLLRQGASRPRHQRVRRLPHRRLARQHEPQPLVRRELLPDDGPTVRAVDADPLLHYELWGKNEGRNTSPWFDRNEYIKTHPGLTIDPLLAFLQSSESSVDPHTSKYAQPEAKMFDAAYYLSHNADVKASGLDPLGHYQTVGWKEHRDPSAAFSTDKYLAAYSDVKAANIDPLNFQAGWGQYQGRQAFAV